MITNKSESYQFKTENDSSVSAREALPLLGFYLVEEKHFEKNKRVDYSFHKLVQRISGFNGGRKALQS